MALLETESSQELMFVVALVVVLFLGTPLLYNSILTPESRVRGMAGLGTVGNTRFINQAHPNGPQSVLETSTHRYWYKNSEDPQQICCCRVMYGSVCRTVARLICEQNCCQSFWCTAEVLLGIIPC